MSPRLAPIGLPGRMVITCENVMVPISGCWMIVIVRRRSVVVIWVIVPEVFVDVQRGGHGRRHEQGLNKHECDESAHEDSLLRTPKHFSVPSLCHSFAYELTEFTKLLRRLIDGATSGVAARVCGRHMATEQIVVICVSSYCRLVVDSRHQDWILSAGDTITRPPDLLPGTLDLLILRTLQKDALHGWAVSERIQEISEDVLQINQDRQRSLPTNAATSADRVRRQHHP